LKFLVLVRFDTFFKLSITLLIYVL
jgi:hypothetical protein